MSAILRVSLLCVILLLSCSAFVDEGPKTTTKTTTTTTTTTARDCDQCTGQDTQINIDGTRDFGWNDGTSSDFWGTKSLCCKEYYFENPGRRLQAKPVRVD